VWWIAILGFVLSRALSVGRAQGTALAILFMLVTIVVTSPFTAPEVT
jgi:threonine/homoserine/homoserine lactone efflux protein